MKRHVVTSPPKLPAGKPAGSRAFAKNLLAILLVMGSLPGALLAQGETADVVSAAWNPHLQIGPIEGLTTLWRSAPLYTAVPLGVLVRLRVAVPESVPVTWLGARALRRDSGGSTAEVQVSSVGGQQVTVRYLDLRGDIIEETSQFEVIDVAQRPVTVSSIHVAADEIGIDPRNPNASSMHYFFRDGSIARLREIGPDTYRTSTNRWLTLTAKVDPPGFAPLVEWRLDGRPQAHAGASISLRVFTTGLHAVSAGPVTAAHGVQLETYRVKITNPQQLLKATSGLPVMLTATTDPPGFENEISWLASTKFGTCSPMSGEGTSFAPAFVDAVTPGGAWIGAKADDAVANLDVQGSNPQPSLTQRTQVQGCVLANILKTTDPEFAKLSVQATIPPLDQCAEPPPDGGVQKVIVCTGHACTCHDVKECACMAAWCGPTKPDLEHPGNENGFCVGLAKLGMMLTCADVV